MRWTVFLVLVCAACKRESPSTEETPVVVIDAASLVEVNVDVKSEGFAIDGRDVKDDAELESRTRELARDKTLHTIIHVREGVPYDRVILAEHALKRGGAAHMTFFVAGTKDARGD
jgi:hypothetical protein